MEKKLWVVPAGAALGLLCALLLRGAAPGLAALSRPFALMGEGLRELSLSGMAGNAAAWAAVLVLSALPLLLLLAGRGKWGPEDLLPVLMAPLMFCLLYRMVNPTLLPYPAREFFPPAAAATLLALLLAWLVLKLLRRLEGAGTPGLARAFSLLLWGLAALLAFAAAFGAAAGALGDWAAAAEGNTDPGALTPAVLCLVAVLNGTPGLLAALTVAWGGRLAAALGGSAFDEAGVALCARTAAACKAVVQATVVLTVLGDLTQLALLEHLRSVSFSLTFPLMSLALSAGLFLLCRLLERGLALQRDSDSII